MNERYGKTVSSQMTHKCVNSTNLKKYRSRIVEERNEEEDEFLEWNDKCRCCPIENNQLPSCLTIWNEIDF
jgi:hypothetical protein